MKRANELTFLALCLALVAFNTLPGCKRRVEPAPKPEPNPVPTIGLVAAADAAETRLEARLRFDAAKMLEDGATLREARDWLAEHWPNAQFEASVKLREAER